ncbi:MAG: ATP-binding cassette domain-containing protein [Candidatus Cloacimonetes bacterium]|nr:ATP-binding cassette domain-containing protein [Candidatus Cloacimonadota bacterium]
MVIQSRNLQKKYKVFEKHPGIVGSIKNLFHREFTENFAVQPFDLEAHRGEFIGLLGPNGAGKTSLMKMFTGITVPSGGSLQVCGHDPSKREIDFRRKIALVMGQKSQLWWDIPALDSFLLLQKYYELNEVQFQARLSEMAALLDVEKLLKIHVRKLSLGERMKMELIASLLHQPEVIFLDEPTIGLDVIAQEKLRAFLLDYHDKNDTTMVLTSHYMADVEALCDRIVLLLNGSKCFDGNIKQFEQILGKEKYLSFHFSEAVDPQNSIFSGFDPKFSHENSKVELRVPEEKLNEVSLSILQQYTVNDYHTEKLPIERVMKTLLENPEIMKTNVSTT